MTEDVWQVGSGHYGEVHPGFNPLLIESRGRLEPLTPEIGVDRRISAPEPLQATLFGDASTVHVDVVLDGAVIPNLPDLLGRSGLAHQCFLSGKAFDALGDVAPWIIRLKREDPFTRNLFTDSRAPWHLWPHASFFILSDAELSDVWRRFRKFVRLQDEDGRWSYFRFWDGAVFPHYFRSLKGQPGKLESWLAPIGESRPQIVAVEHETVWLCAWSGRAAGARVVPTLGAAERTALQECRLNAFIRALSRDLTAKFPEFRAMTEDDQRQWLGTVRRLGQAYRITSEAGIARLAEASLHRGSPRLDDDSELRALLASHHSPTDRSKMVLARTAAGRN